MSREIKFRAWVTDYDPDHDNHYKMIQFNVFNNMEQSLHDENDSVIMQYTGRKDGNDDYIFEKDIASVIIQGHVFGYYQETEYIGIVKYDEKECVYYLDLLKKPIQTGETIPNEIDGIPISSESDEETNRFYFSEYIDEADINILGNIYENPELLEGKS